MANKSVFAGNRGPLAPATDTVNEAGGRAYKMGARQALAQYAATGCLNDTYYVGADVQLETVLDLCKQLDAKYIAQVAVYARTVAHMKDMPALLCAVLSTRKDAKRHGLNMLELIFPRVIDNGKMVRNFVQIMRSGVVGRKSLGTRPKRLVRQWIQNQSPDALFRATVGQSPSIADIIKMVHPAPRNVQENALYHYIVKGELSEVGLTGLAAQYEYYKRGSGDVPNVPFQMLTALELGPKEWTQIARNARWQMTRMNLNTFLRHGVFDDEKMVELVAHRLAAEEQVRASRCFPYQLLTAFHSVSLEMPQPIKLALQDAMEIACENVPVIKGRVIICPDVSGSMSSAATGWRAGSTSATRCIDVAALVTAALLRKNPTARLLPFEERVVSVGINPRDSIMTIANALASIGGGGTNCSAPLVTANLGNVRADLVVYISDCKSWVDVVRGRGTATMQEWSKFKHCNPYAKMVCIDVAPYDTLQAIDTGHNDILNIGGFNDGIFTLLAQFAEGNGGHWVDEIEEIEL